MKKLLLVLVTSFILVPTTVVAVPMTYSGIAVVFVGLSLAFNPVQADTIPVLALFMSIVIGNMGMASMWVLLLHYWNSSAKPSLVLWHYCALLGGMTVSIGLVIFFRDSLSSSALFVSWPLVGAVSFLGLLWASPKKAVV